MELRTLLLLVLVTNLLISVYSDDSSPTVTIAQGTLVGRIYNTTYGSYYAFQGIPYAKPPIGDLRFKAPVPADPWNGTFQAVKEGAICLQTLAISQNTMTGDEDCLFVNVYIAKLPDPNNLLPVMVWINGGGYTGGSGNVGSRGPAFLLNDGVIYVSLNYRLSALGFLSTQDEVVPGNMGMKDQSLALRWVHQNIAAFGGDPEKITIFGESAGGASVSLQVVSPMSAGLFRAAISESGSSANPWSVRESETARNTAFFLGSVLGFTGNSSQELVDFLRAVSADEIILAAALHIPPSDIYRISLAPFVPVVEPAVEGEESFLPDNPINILAQGKFNDVSILTGTNSGESLPFLLGKGILDGTIPADVVNKNFSLMFKPEMRFCKYETCGDEMMARVKSFYFGDEPVTSDNLQFLVNMVTDLFFAEGTMYAVDKFASLGTHPVYLYEFSYVGEISNKNQNPSFANFTGVPHGDELEYIFDNNVETAPGSTDALVRQEMAAMWTNFAKFGNPTPDGADNLPKWLPFSNSATNFLEIDAELSARTDFNKARMDFWKELYGSS